MIRWYKYFFSLLFFFHVFFAHAQREGNKHSRKNAVAHTKISFSPALGFYKANKHHAGKASQKMAFCFSIKEEFRIDKKSKFFIGIGAEYMLHGVKFDSYYFPKDSLKLYNGNMNATYNLTIQELDIPVYL
ncbi:MAG: hypothetical protein V4506_05985, partial [Bacteroidota bacterium]